jgi:hypothetical protein
MAKRRFSSCLASDEITTRWCRALTFAKFTTIMIVKFADKRSGILFQLVGSIGNGVVFVQTLRSHCALCAFVIIH